MKHTWRPHLCHFFKLNMSCSEDPRESSSSSSSSLKGRLPHMICTVCLPFPPMGERRGGWKKYEYKRWGGGVRKRSDDITGGLACVRVEVLTSTVTGRGRTSSPYVGHIKNTCELPQIQPTNWGSLPSGAGITTVRPALPGCEELDASTLR